MTKKKTPADIGADAGAVPAPASASRPPSKLETLTALLRRPGGARLAEMTAATGWQAHSVRGAMSGALKKQRKLTILSEKTESGRLYRIPAEERRLPRPPARSRRRIDAR
jgi:hypothetical protein